MSPSDTAAPAPSCAGDPDPNALSVDEARDRALRGVVPVTGCEVLGLRSALGRTLAEPVRAPLDVPPSDNAAMDGYALRVADLEADGPTVLALAGTALAGVPFPGPLTRGQAARIMTGAPVPEGADCVVMQERTVRVAGDRVRIAAGPRAGDNIRRAGEDLPAGAAVYDAGTRLGCADLGVLASLGIAEVRVWRRPRVAFFSTGDELRPVCAPLAPGQIYDSNRYTLHALLVRAGVEALDCGVVPDRREALRAALAGAAESADLVISSGGVSVGDADFVNEVLAELGRADFWRVAMKPGRPLAFGHVGRAAFFGLPGNPVSVMVTFLQFVLPVLRKIAGQPESRPLSMRVPCSAALRKRPGRTEFQRGRFEWRPDGGLAVCSTGAQGSGVLSSMARADCLIVLPAGSGDVPAGALVEVQPLYGLL